MYIPAGQRAAEAIAANPRKSNVAIADDLGVSEWTVRDARKKSTSRGLEVEDRPTIDKPPKGSPTRINGGGARRAGRAAKGAEQFG